jgi:hypothetical protein
MNLHFISCATAGVSSETEQENEIVYWGGGGGEGGPKNSLETKKKDK